jgi:N,N'-diacetyllegionaminate synthase
MDKKVLIIAEAGVNHNGDIKLAKKLIEIAANAGADYVKFQTFTTDNLVTPKARRAQYQNKNTGAVETQYQMLKRLELTPADHYVLKAHCKKNKIGFMSTGFEIESINFLVSLGQKIIKIPSGEVTNLPYLRHIGSLKKEIIISTGMSTLGEVESAIEVLINAGMEKEKMTILHCTTDYPAKMCDVNLRAMEVMQKAFGIKVGYSDHTVGIEIPIAAVALGAVAIEKHFTLDCAMPGPDHKASIEPFELHQMVSAIRNIEIALGNGIKISCPSEEKNKVFGRKSIVAKCLIKKGELLSEANLTTKRPGDGLSPMYWDKVIGRAADRDYQSNDFIKF